MPQYFFHVRKDSHRPDEVGLDLADAEAARRQAALALAEEMKDHPDQIWNDEEWHVEVTDDRGLILFTLYSAAFQAAAVQKRKP